MQIATLAAGLLSAAAVSVAHISGATAQSEEAINTPRAALIQKIGVEFQANKITKNKQLEPTVAGLSNGNFVVAWEDLSDTPPDVGPGAVRARVFKPNGVAISPTDFLVNNKINMAQIQPAVAGLRNGGFIVTWADNGGNANDKSLYAVLGRRFNNGGAAQGGQFQINRVTQWEQWRPAISQIPTANGGYIVAWNDGSKAAEEDGYGNRAQVFTEAGARRGNEFFANSTINNTQNFPEVAGLTTGQSVVVWEDGSQQTPGDSDFGPVIRGRLIGANGVPVGNDFIINTTVRGEQWQPGVASIGAGRYVVVWEDDNFAYDIRGQVRDAAGNVGGEFLVNTTTTDDQHFPKAVGLGGGKFVVCWVDTSQSGPDFSGDAVRCQVFALNGNLVQKYGKEFTANTRKNDHQGNVLTSWNGGFAVAVLKNGDFVVVYEDHSLQAPDNSVGIRGQVFRVN